VTRSTAWFLHSSTALVAGTGVVYGWMRYFAVPEDEFSLVNHPQEPTLHWMHVVFAPLLVFGCGVLWRNHVWGRIVSGFQSRRKTGILLAALCFPMIASGYFLQVAVEETWQTVWIWVHGVASVVWTLGYLVHHLLAKDVKVQARVEEDPT